MTIEEYVIGESAVLTAEVVDPVTGQPAEPSSVTVKVRPPSGVVAVYTSTSTPGVTNPADGMFRLILPAVTQAGDWFYRFEGSEIVTAGESRFIVRPSAFDPAAGPSANQWISGASLLDEPRLDDANMPPGVTLDMCAEAATAFLYNRSGRRFRLRDVVLHPNQHSCGCWESGGWCGRAEIDLPGPVVANSLVVTIDGVVQAPTSYRLYDRHLLVRTGGEYWPMCSHLGSPTGVEWSIAFSVGQAPDMGGILACRELAVHVALACSGKQGKPPVRATTITTRGLSLNLLRGRRTGIALVDDWLDAVNPHNLAGRPSVMSPDTIRLSDADAG